MNEQALVLQNPDANTIALVFSWLSRSTDTDQDAEGDYVDIHTDQSEATTSVLLGGAATGPAPQTIFWRTRQVQHFLSSRQVLERYQAVRRDHERRMQREAEQPEFPIEPAAGAGFGGEEWYLDSRSNSTKSSSLTDPEVYQTSDSKSSDSESSQNEIDKVEVGEQLPEDQVPPGVDAPSAPTAPDPLDNLQLRAFILDLEDVEMTPMLHLVANMMTSMYFNEEETAVVHHYLLHKVEATINNIQRRMDQLNAAAGREDQTEEEEEEDSTTPENEEEDAEDEEDDSDTITEDFFDAQQSPTLPEEPSVVVPAAEPRPLEHDPDGEPKQELLVERVDDEEGVTESSMKVVTQMMAVKSGRKRKALIKKARLNQDELAVVRYFERSMRVKSSWWKCCGGRRTSPTADIPYY